MLVTVSEGSLPMSDSLVIVVGLARLVSVRGCPECWGLLFEQIKV